MESFGRNKTIFVFFIVLGCFTVLLSQFLYPVIMKAFSTDLQPNQYDKGTNRGARDANIRPGKPHPAFGQPRKSEPDINFLPPKKPHGSAKRPPPLNAEKYVKKSQQNSFGIVGFLLPVYTLALVVFSIYAAIKTLNNRKNTYPDIVSNEDFRREVFLQTATKRQQTSEPFKESKKIGDDEDLIELKRRLRETEVAMERLISQINSKPNKNYDKLTIDNFFGSVTNAINALVAQVDQDIAEKRQLKGERTSSLKDDYSVKVVGVEASVNKSNLERFNSDEESKSENFPDPFKKYSVNDRDSSIGDSKASEIVLNDLSLGKNAQVLVTDTVTVNELYCRSDSNDNNNNTMVLRSKMTLSVINNTDEESDDDDDEFEKQEFSKYSTASLHTAIDQSNPTENTDDEIDQMSEHEL